MATDATNNIVINAQTAQGVPAWLDYTSLRSAAISYLGPVTGSIWTDYNEHDPGITTLEVLIYALLDLGYRSSLPLEDILARDPAQTGSDADFFTPGQILGCNPLTLLDYRKLLLDVEGVRNAWIEVMPEANPPSGINGLYQVYIEPDQKVEEFKTAADFEAYKNTILCRIRQVLMSHRNLCEDFYSVYFLCDVDVGVCADIELVGGTDVGACYQQLMTTLAGWFSPSPVFYTLPQLLAKKTPIETVFAGRPRSGSPSHGFLDACELDKIVRRTEVHVSDVFAVILAVPGVQRIRKLQLRVCPAGGNPIVVDMPWVLPLPANSLPAFSIPCGKIQFFQNGRPLQTDLSAYDAMLELKLATEGKVLYPADSPNLDSVVPPGHFRTDLGDYYSIQRDFPQVYGIGEGSLPANASPSRVAQARQFKGFLLFFDQLLADYLAQLSHIRDLFALGKSADPTANHSYFIGDVSSVPDLNALLRFPGSGTVAGAAASGGSGVTAGGPVPGTPLCYPVERKLWHALHGKTLLSKKEWNGLTAYSFDSAAERDYLVEQLALSFAYASPEVVIVQNSDTNCYRYVIVPSEEDYVLVGRDTFTDGISANQQAALVLFLGQDIINYSRGNEAQTDRFTFTIDQSDKRYLQYLQTILEDGALYRQRRKTFLDHLLARFAEVFTDYALLFLGNTKSAKFEEGQIGAIEKMLANYPALSADRGKAMNYLQPGWNDDNIPGLERRFYAYAGIDDWTRHHLCNFEVVQQEEMFQLKLILANTDWFVSKGSFIKEEATAALGSLIPALANAASYEVVQPVEDFRYALDVHFYNGNVARSSMRYASPSAARESIGVLADLFGFRLRGEPVVEISRYEYHLSLLNSDGRSVRYGRQAYSSPEEAQTQASASVGKPEDAEVWKFEEGADPIGALIRNKEGGHELQFMVLSGFNISVDDDIPKKPGRWRFQVLDNQNEFALYSLDDFEQEAMGYEACLRFLYGLAEDVSYAVEEDEGTGRWRIRIAIDGQEQAISDADFVYRSPEDADAAAKGLLAKARTFLYRVAIVPEPDRWRFFYTAGTSAAEITRFGSVEEYLSPDAAADAAWEFAAGGRSWAISAPGEALTMRTDKGIAVKPEEAAVPGKTDAGESGTEVEEAAKKETGVQRAKMDTLVQLKHTIGQLNDGDAAVRAPMIVKDAKTQAGTYIYRLVDKDHPKAKNPVGMNDRSSADALRKTLAARKDYPFLEICLGGDRLVQQHGEGTSEAAWYYQVKSRNDYFESRGITAKPIVLFESIQGYESPAAAQAAFGNHYLEILNKGMDATQYGYGPGKWISLDAREDIQQQLTPTGIIPQVLVPERTQQELGVSGKDPIAELVLACQSYPVRSFIPPAAIDPCDPPPSADPCSCTPGETQPGISYQFVLFNTALGVVDWESIGSFATPGAATDAFYFFLTLLAFPGNLFVRQDDVDCLYYVLIREVLAESVATFKDPTAAWGADGVEKFIGISQGRHGFHLQLRQENCSYSFWVGCPDCRLQHPCRYDTPGERDAVRLQLYQAYQNWAGKDWLAGFDTSKIAVVRTQVGTGDAVGTLHGLDGQPLADVFDWSRSKANNLILDPILDVIDVLWLDGQYRQDSSGMSLLNLSGAVIAKSAATYTSLKDWKKALQGWAIYFPLTRKTEEKGGLLSYTYHFRVNFPGFPGQPGDASYYMPCGCGPESGPGSTTCYTAWRNHLAYTESRVAWGDYVSAYGELADVSSYRGVFACDCGGYGIEICPASAVIAINPQSYYLSDDACDAVERAKRCINAEGLELVEHILLRPCPNEAGIPVCDGGTTCNGTWTEINKQGAAQSPPLAPFVPGADPYSFIATVALPAWPLRFSKPENRLQLELMMQREAPAHVLLRILWLCPEDMCRYERYYKKWLYWLQQPKSCLNFDRNGFLQFLFSTSFRCWVPPAACCPETMTVTPNGCWAVGKNIPVTQGSQDWLSAIDQLYCWTDMECADTARWTANIKKEKAARGVQLALKHALAAKAVEKEKETALRVEVELAARSVRVVAEDRAGDEDEDGETVGAGAAGDVVPGAGAPEPANAEDAAATKAAAANAAAATAAAAANAAAAAANAAKFRLLQGRLDRYRQWIDGAKQSGKDKLATDALDFINPNSRKRSLPDIAEEMAMALEKARKQRKEKIKVIIGSIVAYWLDISCLWDGMKAKLSDLKEVLDTMGLIPDDPEAFYREWRGTDEEVAALRPDEHMQEIREVLTGQK